MSSDRTQSLLDALNKHYLDELNRAVDDFTEAYDAVDEDEPRTDAEGDEVCIAAYYVNDIKDFFESVIECEGDYEDEEHNNKSFLTVIREECGWDAQWSDMSEIVEEAYGKVFECYDLYYQYCENE